MLNRIAVLVVLLGMHASANAFMPTTTMPAELGLRASRSCSQRPMLQRVSRHPARLRGGVVETNMGGNFVQAAKTATLVYAVLMGAGGIVAGLKAGSKPSIISGTVASVVLGYAYSTANLALSFGTAIALSVVFAIRFVKTKKFMPAGLLGSLSVVFGALFGIAKFG